jgi:ferrous iron transport protein A
VNATELQIGQSARITEIADGYISKKLMEMGCIPGTRIELEFRSPGGDPIALNIDGYVLGLRVSEAEFIHVEPELVG